MSRGPRFTILNILAAIVVLAVAFAAFRFFSEYQPDPVRGEVIFWLVAFGVAVCTMLAFRLLRSRETRLISLGLVLALAASVVGLYLPLFLPTAGHPTLIIAGLMAIAAILVGGGIIDGLIVRWRDRSTGTLNPSADPPVAEPSSGIQP